jgi:hypothetical protein
MLFFFFCLLRTKRITAVLNLKRTYTQTYMCASAIRRGQRAGLMKLHAK